jgi:pimeloyl-ACP methyl ester carboxylesterase
MRLARLNEKERAEFKAVVEALENPAGTEKDELLARLSSLAAKTDDFARIEESGETNPVQLNSDIYQKVWKEAAEMRRGGQLISFAEGIKCPVVAIHGDYDPTPIEGVSEPLSAVVDDFRMVKLEKCGHTPWIERYARDTFYRVFLDEID